MGIHFLKNKLIKLFNIQRYKKKKPGKGQGRITQKMKEAFTYCSNIYTKRCCRPRTKKRPTEGKLGFSTL
jgi:hypothetical protein